MKPLSLVALVGLACSCTAHRQLVMGPALSSRAAAIIGAAQSKLYSAGQPGRAAELAREALAIDPNAAGAHEVLAQVAVLADDIKVAFEHWFAALADGRSQAVGLYLGRIGPHHMLRRAQRERLAALLADIAVRHRSFHARDAARRHLVPLLVSLGEADKARRVAAKLGLIRRFRAIAGFDNLQDKGYDTPYAPETEIKLERKYPGQRGMVAWRRVEHLGPLASLRLRDYFYPFHSNVAYLLSYLRSASKQQLMLHITTSVPIKVWLNDRSVLATRRIKHANVRQIAVPVTLARGHNKLLVKSCQGKGTWSVSLALRKPDGRDAVVSVGDTPQPYEHDRRPPARFRAGSALPPSLAQLKRGARRSYWIAVALGAAGLRQVASRHLGRHLVRYRRDVMALLLAARIAREQGQLQRATQLTDVGRRMPKPLSFAFELERIRLYRQRGQQDRAFDVIASVFSSPALASKRTADARQPRIALAPGQRSVFIELDRLYASKGWALDRCREARALHRVLPDALFPLSTLASCNFALGRVRRSLRWLRRAVQVAPASQSLRRRLARALARIGRCRSGLAVVRSVVSDWPTRVYHRMALGHFYRRCGDRARALATYKSVAAQAPAWDRPYKAMGLVHFEQGRIAQAISAWREALERNPDDSRLWDRVSHLEPLHDPILEKQRLKESDIAAVIASGRAVKAVEGASIVWLLDHEVSRLMPDGTLKRVVTIVRRAVDRAGRDALGQAKLPRSGLVKVLEAYSIDRRGRRREVTSMHGRRVRYPTLSEGAVVVLQYRHIRNPRGYLRHHLATSWYFQHPLGQVVRAEWKLALPAERKLRIAKQGGPISHSKVRSGKVMIHSFSSTNVPPLRPERRSLPTRDLLRSVAVSTVPSWDYFSSWGRSLTEDVFELDPQLERLLARLIRGAKTVQDKVRRVYHYAIRAIRYQQDYETFIAGVKPHPATVVLARGYGDCKDKSVLIISMLRKLGIKAHLALVRTRRVGRVQPQVPSQQFNHAVAYLPPQKGIARGRFLDATAETLDIDTLRHDTQGTLSLVLFPRGHKLVPIPYQTPEHNRMDVSVHLALDASGSAKARTRLLMTGHRAGALRKPMQNRQQLRQYGQLIVASLYPDTTLRDVQVKGERSVLEPLSISLRAHTVGAARTEEGALRLRLPRIVGAMPMGSAPWSERRHPLFFGPPTLVTSKLEIALPPGLEVQSHPKGIKLSGPCFVVHGSWRKDAAKRTLTYQQQTKRTCAVLSAKRYPAFRKAVKKLKRALEEEVVLSAAGKRKKAKKSKKAKKAKRRRKTTKTKKTKGRKKKKRGA